jgi:hypothetical protein
MLARAQSIQAARAMSCDLELQSKVRFLIQHLTLIIQQKSNARINPRRANAIQAATQEAS